MINHTHTVKYRYTNTHWSSAVGWCERRGGGNQAAGFREWGNMKYFGVHPHSWQISKVWLVIAVKIDRFPPHFYTQTPTCVCCGMFRKLLSRDPMPTNLLGAVAPGVEYARETEEEQKKVSTYTTTAGTSTSSAIVTFLWLSSNCKYEATASSF